MKKISAVILLLLATAMPAMAQTQMPEAVVSAGGVRMTDGTTRLQGTLSQTAIGTTSGVSYGLKIGFWHDFHELVSAAPEIPDLEWGLKGNYPNPFNPKTNIAFSLPTDSQVSLGVYNLRGELVRTLVDGTVPAGNHSVRWDGRDSHGSGVASGVYVARIVSQHGELTQKMVLAR